MIVLAIRFISRAYILTVNSSRNFTLLFVSFEMGSVTFIDQSYISLKLLSTVETFKDELSNCVKKVG